MELSEYSLGDFFAEFQRRGLVLDCWKTVGETELAERRALQQWRRRVLPKHKHDSPRWRCVAIADRLSREKPININKYNEIARKASSKFSGAPSNTYNSIQVSLRDIKECGHVAYYKGKWLYAPSSTEHDDAEQECHTEGRSFTKLSELKARKQRAIYIRSKRDEKIYKENKALLSQLKQEIKNGE